MTEATRRPRTAPCASEDCGVADRRSSAVENAPLTTAAAAGGGFRQRQDRPQVSFVICVVLFFSREGRKPGVFMNPLVFLEYIKGT